MHALNILNFDHLKGVRGSAMDVHFSDNIPFSTQWYKGHIKVWAKGLFVFIQRIKA